MKKILSLTLALALALGLTSCAMEDDVSYTDKSQSASGSQTAKPGKGEKRVVNVCSWGEYISNGDEGSRNLEKEFEELTGIEVNYVTVPSNEDLYALLEQGGVDYDVIVPSDYMIGRLIEEGRLQKLDYSKIPNYEKIDEQYKNLSFDPNNEYSVPYTWGTLGIIYNTKMVDGPIDSWGVMFDEKYAGDILLIDNSRDAFAMALYYLGYDVNTTDEAQIREAYQLVADAKARGQYDGQGMDEVFQIMEGGNLAIATYYAGDFLSMHENNPDLAFCIPKEGSNWFVDSMCILKDAKNVDEAHEWINFIASTQSNLANMDYIWYASPNAEALEQYPAWYEEEYGEPLDLDLYKIMATPAETLKRCSMYENLPQETLDLYTELWTKLGI